MSRFSFLSIQLLVSSSGTLVLSRAMTTNSKIAVAQLCSSSSKIRNLMNVAKCAGLAKQQNCSMLFLPECFGFLGENSEQTLKNAEPPVLEDTTANDPAINEALASIVTEPGSQNDKKIESCVPTNGDARVVLLDGLRQVAKTSGLWISAGGMHVSGAPHDEVSQRERVYNTHVVIDNLGELKAVYKKIHLFDVSIPGKVDLRESATTAAGEDLVVCDSPIGKLGLSTCYDVRFPEMYIPLVEQGAEILLVPSAFTVPTGSAHWHVLLRARAIESQCFVVAAAQFGQHNEKRKSYGHSLVVNPWGDVIADAGGVDSDDNAVTPSIITCDIDRTQITSVRERMPVQLHRANAKMHSRGDSSSNS